MTCNGVEEKIFISAFDDPNELLCVATPGAYKATRNIEAGTIVTHIAAGKTN